jgi:hypothetical protein
MEGATGWVAAASARLPMVHLFALGKAFDLADDTRTCINP